MTDVKHSKYFSKMLKTFNNSFKFLVVTYESSIYLFLSGEGYWLLIKNHKFSLFQVKKNSKVQFCLKFVFTAIQKESKK